ncbi:MAG: hypothetical protein WC916_03170 [Candidatus Woesearchaeota archaeon]
MVQGNPVQKRASNTRNQDSYTNHAISNHNISDRVISDRVISDRVISDRVISDRVISDRVISDRVISDRVISDRIISHHEIIIVTRVMIMFLCYILISSISIPQSSALSMQTVQNSAGLSSNNPLLPITVATDAEVFSVGDVVHIYLFPNDLLSQNKSRESRDSLFASLSLEVTLQEDTSYLLKYLGALDNDISFIPQKPGTYYIKVYLPKSYLDYQNIVNSNIVDSNTLGSIIVDSSPPDLGSSIEKTFVVYAESAFGCKEYAAGENVDISLRDYAPYHDNASLPASVMLIYSNINYSEKLLYSQEIRDVISYSSARLGKYSLYADGDYLDCFVITDKPVISQSNSDAADAGTLIVDAGALSVDSSIPDLDALIQKREKRNMPVLGISQALNISKDTIADMNALNNGLIAVRILKNNSNLTVLSELLVIDLNRSIAILIGFNESAPADDFTIGVKDQGIVWISKNHETLYLFDTQTATHISRRVLPYNVSKGELGTVLFLNTSLTNETGRTELPIDFAWDVEFDNQQFYFYNPQFGQTFSDDDMKVKEAFRKLMDMDQILRPQDIAHLDLEIDRDFVNADEMSTT